MRWTSWLVVGILALDARTGAAQEWHARVSGEFPAATAAIQAGSPIPGRNQAQFFSGYGVELGAERELRRGLTAGVSVFAAGGLAPGACESDLVGSDSCDDPFGRSVGAFAIARQYVPRSITGAHVVATIGAGIQAFDAFYLGRHFSTTGPAALYGLEAETGRLWRMAFAVGARGNLVVDPKGSPLQLTTLTIGLRAR